MRASVAFVLGIIAVLIVSCDWSVAEPDVAHLSFSSFRCPRGCTCTGTTTDCSHRGLAQVPKNIPPETERL
ncbi:hypothetical protein BDFB_004115 [Asbolus verrucosus]|uniref:LRRNT domain-containing protein n=1 Tax=Asbolus verrucosus TaxID=1661398 RepID=A0A482WAC9_ASBVE|nr:hypothetical protein BDFB_004115 [Asbolus verrucosus]